MGLRSRALAHRNSTVVGSLRVTKRQFIISVVIQSLLAGKQYGAYGSIQKVKSFLPTPDKKY